MTARRPRVPRVPLESPSGGRGAAGAHEPAADAPADAAGETTAPEGATGPEMPGTESTTGTEGTTGAEVISAEADPAVVRRRRAASIASEPDATVTPLRSRPSAPATFGGVPSPQGAESAGDAAEAPARAPGAAPIPPAGSRSRTPSASATAERRRRAAQRRQAQHRRRREPAPPPVPARSLTGRSLLVVVILLVAVSVLAPHLRLLLNQQLEIAAAQEDIAAQEAQRDAYERRIEQWDDEEFVRQQARDRIGLVMPGETLYMVTGEDRIDREDQAPASVLEEPVNENLPWAEGLWDSVVRAGTE